MRILIDIGHPGHVHLFRPFAQEMIKKGHTILFTCREKEFEIELLQAGGFDYKSFGKKFNTIPGKIFGLVKFDSQELLTALKFKPDIFLSHGSPYAAHAAFLMRKPHVSMEDSGNWEQIKLYLPFTKYVLTPSVLYENIGKKQIRYDGYHELAYLHPDVFNPSESIYGFLNIPKEENYAIVRFVSWNATHDRGQGGLLLEEKKELIKLLQSKMKVYISSEEELPEEFLKYKISIPPERMHDALSFAGIFIGEGATMASEAGVLGTPSIYINSLRRAYNEDQETYGLVFNFRNGDGVIKKVKEILSFPDYKAEWEKRRSKLLTDKINVTDFLVWFIENYPESEKIMKENPDYQYRFK